MTENRSSKESFEQKPEMQIANGVNESMEWMSKCKNEKRKEKREKKLCYNTNSICIASHIYLLLRPYMMMMLMMLLHCEFYVI